MNFSQLINFYKTLLARNHVWIRRISYWALGWFVMGTVVGLVFPDAFNPVFAFIRQVYKNILGTGTEISHIQLVWVIFKQNVQAVLIGLCFGVMLGIVPFLIVAGNFFIIGFLFSSTLRKSIVSGLVMLAVLLPHGIVELPALLLGCAFGVRLGLFWMMPEKKLTILQKFGVGIKDALAAAPLIIVLLFLAAFIEVYVSGYLIELLAPFLKPVFA